MPIDGLRRAFRRAGRSSAATDVNDELAFHITRRVEELIALGMSPTEARAEACSRASTSHCFRASSASSRAGSALARPDILSLLLFQENYLSRLIELGEADADARAEEIQAFIEND
jgi:hypothetical protein